MTHQNQISSRGSSMSRWFLLGFALIALEQTPAVNSFAISPQQTRPFCPSTVLFAEENGEEAPKPKSNYDPEDEVQRRLEKARAILAKSKAKLEAKDTNNGDTANGEASSAKAAAAPIPFFAAKSVTKDPKRLEKLIKAKNDKTGLVTADGEIMAAMSEAEEWEKRSLHDVFQNELEDDEDVYSEASRQLAERDVAASIWNLRKQMKTEDYMKIFDKRNRFIGEDN